MMTLEPVLIPGLWEKLIAQNDITHADNLEILDRTQAKLTAALTAPEPDWTGAK